MRSWGTGFSLLWSPPLYSELSPKPPHKVTFRLKSPQFILFCATKSPS